jgi:gamma-glutamylcysteine synthetase
VCEQYGLGWFASRLNPYLGTVEDRVACQQPPADQLVTAALALGLAEELTEAEALVATRDAGTWRALRSTACRHGFAAAGSMVTDAEALLDIAARGLARRAQGEETFLEPLHERLAERRSPASRLMDVAPEARWPWIHGLLRM